MNDSVELESFDKSFNADTNRFKIKKTTEIVTPQGVCLSFENGVLQGTTVSIGGKKDVVVSILKNLITAVELANDSVDARHSVRSEESKESSSKKTHMWTNDDIQILKSKELTLKQKAELIGVTTSAAYKKAMRVEKYGFEANNKRKVYRKGIHKWTKDEQSYLLSHKDDNLIELSQKFKVTDGAIRLKLKELLQKQHGV